MATNYGLQIPNRMGIANQFDLPLDYSADDLQARTTRAMTQPGMQIEFAPYEKGVPEELQFWDGRPFTPTAYDPYKVYESEADGITNYDFDQQPPGIVNVDAVRNWTNRYGNPELYQGFVERGDPLPYEPSQNWFQKMWSGAQNKLGEGWNFAKEVPGMAISAAMGVPFIGQGIMAGLNAFQDMLGPNYRAMVEKDLKGQGFTVDGLGRIVKTGDYATPENIMAGYSLAHPNITGSAFDRYDDIRERIKRGKFKNVERAKKKLDALGQFALQKEAARKAAYDKAIQDAKNAKKAERARIKSISAGYGGHDDRPGATGPTAAGAGMGVGGGYASDYGYLKDGGRVGYANGGLASLFTRRG